ncbi:MAG TPA: pyridoxamine 5'-phosphate oxidase family protein [Myxococcota bacterium]|nr:pyridoxamine 5'-phosphate oxidase family protein [Myxococcota bacterium]
MNGLPAGKDLSPALINALHGEMVPKFMATLDDQGRPNVVPIISLDTVGGGKLVFAEFLIHKTRANLERDHRIAACVITEDLCVWTLRADFECFAEEGPYLDYLNKKDMFRYNAYVGVRRAAVFKLLEVSEARRLSKLNVACELLPLMLQRAVTGRGKKSGLPPRVAEKFARSQALKVLAFKGESGYPEIVPAFSLVPDAENLMLFGTRLFRKNLQALKLNQRVAAAVITMDPVAYQVKGVFDGISPSPAGKLGRIRVDQVYSASPPLPGEPIAMPEKDLTSI